MENKSVIVANITWNPDGWRNIHIDPRAGHAYARKYPGHECLNFKFDKKNLDTRDIVYGFVQWTAPPANFEDGGIIIFYTRNLETGHGEIVGIYCNARLIEPRRTPWKEFENGMLESNIAAHKRVSMLFPIALSAKRYSKNRLVPQIGFTYKDIDFARRVVTDELRELSRSGVRLNEFRALQMIFQYITGKRLNVEETEPNSSEQDELDSYVARTQTKSEIIAELEKLKQTDPEHIEVNHKTYKRDAKTIAQLKKLRDHRCQICGYGILKKSGELYVEAAHIIPKSQKGPEMPDNILILCPNHHREFDVGKKQVITHTRDAIKFELNDNIYNIDLRLLQR
ncbi:MAG TPA: HNH endonuclease [Syntrophorhabdaceae bacterium]|nr:HNH endonuclease [Syntrophorhabdaceae bacterium]